MHKSIQYNHNQHKVLQTYKQQHSRDHMRFIPNPLWVSEKLIYTNKFINRTNKVLSKPYLTKIT